MFCTKGDVWILVSAARRKSSAILIGHLRTSNYCILIRPRLSLHTTTFNTTKSINSSAKHFSELLEGIMSRRGLENVFHCCDCAVKRSTRGHAIHRRNFTSSISWRRHGENLPPYIKQTQELIQHQVLSHNSWKPPLPN